MCAPSAWAICFRCLVLIGLVAIMPVAGEARSSKIIDVEGTVAKAYKDCAEKWGFAGPIATCVAEKEHEYGDRLARAYRQALYAAGTNKLLLRESQRAWLKFQQADCGFQEQMSAPDGPSFARSALASCNLQTTLQRLNELKKFVAEPKE
jgi:uncharacterized protein YecT (DUF1311 family)